MNTERVDQHVDQHMDQRRIATKSRSETVSFERAKAPDLSGAFRIQGAACVLEPTNGLEPLTC